MRDRRFLWHHCSPRSTLTTGRDGKPTRSAENARIISLTWITTDTARRDRSSTSTRSMDIPKVLPVPSSPARSFSPKFSGRELGSFYQVSAQMRRHFPRAESHHSAIHVIRTCRFCLRCLTHPRSVCHPFSLTVTNLWPRKIEKSYLVFVAIKDIYEGVELTIDYHPNLGTPSRGKGKRKRRGSEACMCDARFCRGARP